MADGGELRLNRLRRILQYHFDLELLLKYRELKLLELEIARGDEIRACLEKLLLNEVVYPDRHTRQEYSSLYISNSPSASSTPSNTNSNPVNTTTKKPSSSLPLQHQYELKADGTVVKLRCPACFADKFKSMLGFLNHCRIHCHVIFTSPEDRQIRAGIPVDPDTVPPDVFSRHHPTVVKQEQCLAHIRSDLQPIFPVLSAPSQQESSIHFPNPKDSTSSFSEDKLLNSAGPLTGEVTRFYIHKRLIIGNNARCLKPSEISSTSSPLPTEGCLSVPFTHSMKIYLRPPPPNISGQRDSLSKWIRFVRFYLHPSFSESAVDVYQEPFELSRETFGEFPIKVQLNFWDSKRNPPFDIIHHVRIFQAITPGKTIAGPERMYGVELDRNTDFSLYLVNPSAPDGLGSLDERFSTARSDFEVLSEAVRKNRMVDISVPEGAGMAVIDKAKLAYCEGILGQIRLMNPKFCLSAKEIFSWLSKNRKDFFVIDNVPPPHTAAADNNSGSAVGSSSSHEPTRFCCYCGQPHEPAHRFEILQKNCSFKPRKVRLSSRTELTNYVHGRYVLSETALPDESFRYSSYNPTMTHSRPKSNYNSLKVHGVPSDSSLIKSACDDKMSIDAKVTCNFLIKIFAKRLVARSLTIANDSHSSAVGRTATPTRQKTIMLTPLHVYNALMTNSAQQSDNPMDFITLENMQA